MTSTQQTYQYGRPPCAIGSQGLGKQTEHGEAGEDEHGTHTTGIGIHALALHKVLGQIATTNAEHGHDEVKGEYQHDTHR